MLTHRVPFPPDRGDRIRSWNLLRHLSERFEISLGCVTEEAVSDETRSRLEAVCRRVSIAPIGSRMKWCRAGLAAARGGGLTEGLFWSPQLAGTLDDWALRESFAGVLVYCSGMLRYTRRESLCRLPRFVDLVDVDSEKFYAYAAKGPRWKRWLYRCEAGRVRALEHEAVRTSKAVMLVSDAEAALLRSTLPPGEYPIHGIANGVDIDYFSPPPTPVPLPSPSQPAPTVPSPSNPPPTVPSSTTVPSSSVPPSSVPPSTVPPSTVPPSTVPPTTVPPSTVPPTTVPPTPIPPSTIPPSTIPSSSPLPTSHSSLLTSSPSPSPSLPLSVSPCLPPSPLPPLRLVFVGVMNYPPNVEAIEWFVERVWPAVRERNGDAVLEVVGKSPSAAIERLGERAGVNVVGAVADVRPYLRSADMVIAPLQIARGIQNKVLEAMAMGRAVIASPEAATGIEAVDGVHLRVAKTPEQWIERIQELSEDDGLRERMESESRRLVCDAYTWSATLGRLDPLFDTHMPLSSH
ncbi:Cell surface antigen I/II precursor [Novipirellula galeiformis]|uniref:Cell surface antigen I/II n=1 Tax=Novipirellula galeiformis TaxID=2528004 RepID=A0A5C6CAI2_9BACT|nr:glycosyltransferase [Novipirellula galeiformis]TWU21228.1 Cell surface antigen I/II precursor [Novipirellula galeiformis]